MVATGMIPVALKTSGFTYTIGLDTLNVCVYGKMFFLIELFLSSRRL